MKRPDGIEVRFATENERQSVAELAESFKATKAMGGVWTRWQAWDKSPPVVAIDNGEVIGFHALMYGTRNGYANSYYLGVKETHQGRGIAASLVGMTLKEAMRLGIRRLKFRAKEGSQGAIFWMGMGARAFGQYRNELLFDVDISGLQEQDAPDEASAFVAWMKKPMQHQPIPQDAMQRWRKLEGIVVFEVDK